MKIRNGFVSNSSSSSFVCSICGEIESGMDLCLEDVCMVQCVKGHTWHLTCDTNKPKDEKYETGKWDEVTEKACPLCTLKYLSDNEELTFLRNKTGLTKEDSRKILLKEKEEKNG
jgi:hypothetical protein